MKHDSGDSVPSRARLRLTRDGPNLTSRQMGTRPYRPPTFLGFGAEESRVLNPPS